MPLKDLADMIGLSEGYFAHAFKVSTGMSPHRWYLAAKIQEAQKALLQTSDTLAQVALANGFADQSHFTRAFRTITGYSPGLGAGAIRHRNPILPLPKARYIAPGRPNLLDRVPIKQ
ncbi:helix-turn-helix transcriptional regulator [Mesorhizobium argentiipisi]|uniref:Helix-turn-helix transcriptional regulator n=1 Tax=Mesorhizobium argentiipisi TaxID=3015175 RepID=A0ABU8K731_9HYPH